MIGQWIESISSSSSSFSLFEDGGLGVGEMIDVGDGNGNMVVGLLDPLYKFSSLLIPPQSVISTFTSMLIVVGGEMCVDGMKHIFIINFNQIDAYSVYNHFSKILKRDLMLIESKPSSSHELELDEGNNGNEVKEEEDGKEKENGLRNRSNQNKEIEQQEEEVDQFNNQKKKKIIKSEESSPSFSFGNRHYALSRRLGITHVPLVGVSIRFLYLSLISASFSKFEIVWLIVGWIILLMIKLSLGLGLIQWSLKPSSEKKKST